MDRSKIGRIDFAENWHTSSLLWKNTIKLAKSTKFAKVAELWPLDCRFWSSLSWLSGLLDRAKIWHEGREGRKQSDGITIGMASNFRIREIACQIFLLPPRNFHPLSLTFHLHENTWLLTSRFVPCHCWHGWKSPPFSMRLHTTAFIVIIEFVKKIRAFLILSINPCPQMLRKPSI